MERVAPEMEQKRALERANLDDNACAKARQLSEVKAEEARMLEKELPKPKAKRKVE